MIRRSLKTYHKSSTCARTALGLCTVLLTVAAVGEPSRLPRAALVSGVSFETDETGTVARVHFSEEIPWYGLKRPDSGPTVRLTLLDTQLAPNASMDPAPALLQGYRLYEEGTTVVMEIRLASPDIDVRVTMDSTTFDLLIYYDPKAGSSPVSGVVPGNRISPADSLSGATPIRRLALADPTDLPESGDLSIFRSAAEKSGNTAENVVTKEKANDVDRLFSAALKKPGAGAANSDSTRASGGSSRWKLDTIVIDAGHGGDDTGAFGQAGFQEKDLALIIALRVGRMVEENLGVRVVYTRTDDRFIPVAERGRIANEAQAKLFISIHANQAASSRARGTETYFLGVHRSDSAQVVMERENRVVKLEADQRRYDQYNNATAAQKALARSAYMKNSELLATDVQRQFTDVVGRKDRGVKQAGFYVLFGASMPSILIELGFLSNPDEEQFLMSTGGQTSMANAIFRAIQHFKLEYEKSLQVAPR